jgi:signal transduction histidine kinase
LGFVLAIFSTRKILKLEATSAREISQARGELKHLSARLLEAQEEERRLISRELYDEVGQALTGVLLEMANLSNLIRNREESALSKKADEIKKLLEAFNPPQERGMGLIGMEERVSALGGRLVVESASGEGTLLRVALPLPQAVTAHGAAAKPDLKGRIVHLRRYKRQILFSHSQTRCLEPAQQ